jgi:parallel beta helix pectate lyase-like protein
MKYALLLCRALALGALLASPLAAQVLHVRAGAPGGNGSSWATAMNDLGAALVAAGSNPQVTAVWVAEGRYRPSLGDPAATFAVPDGVALYGGFAGTETSPAQRDLAHHVTVLDGDLLGDDLPGFVNYADNSFHVLTAAGVVDVELDGLTVRGGSQGQGAGIRILARNVRLANLVVAENWGLGNNNNGGGLFVDAETTVASDCVFRDNRATAGAGARLVYDGWSGSASFERCSFARNDGQGLLAHGFQPFELTLRDTSFQDNLKGGLTTSSEQPIVLTLEACTLERNQATSGSGLALISEQACDVTIAGCVFRENHATAGGGVALDTEQMSTLTALDSLFERNQACAGGGVRLLRANASFERCAFLRNHRADCGSGAHGGAIQLEVSAHTEIVDSLFTDSPRVLVWSRATELVVASSTFLNANSSAASIHVERGQAELRDSIVLGAGSAQVTLGLNGTVAASHSNVHMGGAGLPGPGNLDVDPLFVSPIAGDLRLAPGSPCIDAGDPTRVRVGADFERDSRMLDGDGNGTVVLDMGADEFGPLRLSVEGTPAVGSTLTFRTSGVAGLTSYLCLGRPALRHFPQVGSFFLHPAGLVVVPFGLSPSTFSALVPPGVAGLFHCQVYAVGSGRRVFSNYVPLDF